MNRASYECAVDGLSCGAEDRETGGDNWDQGVNVWIGHGVFGNPGFAFGWLDLETVGSEGA